MKIEINESSNSNAFPTAITCVAITVATYFVVRKIVTVAGDRAVKRYIKKTNLSQM